MIIDWDVNDALVVPAYCEEQLAWSGLSRLYSLRDAVAPGMSDAEFMDRVTLNLVRWFQTDFTLEGLSSLN